MKLPSKLPSCLAVALVVASATTAQAAKMPLLRNVTFPATGAKTTSRTIHADASKTQVGSANEATADPSVARPNEAPCVDTIFSGATFAAYAAQTFTYAPPAGCPGPYNKIVFNGNFSVSAGIQFDRTASIEIGNVPIYFGTTAEPNPGLGPTWHVERDVTDDAALLGKPQSVEADIFNIVNSTYTGIISGTAYLQFYPAHGKKISAATTPDLVLPFPGVTGGPQILSTGASTLTATYTLPTNVEKVYMDVYAQSQQTDEQYFLCAPSDVASDLFTCGNGPLRQTEISIDGTPAGAAPVYPWIFTGGLDPYLWAPIPGEQTLEFKPYRLDLTPFAALLANGKPHTVVLSVDNADNYFQGFATLFLYQDHHLKRVTGALTKNTLVANPAPSVTEKLTGSPPSLEGTILTTSSRNYETAGYVNTYYGRVSTEVKSTLGFSNLQTYSNESDFTGTTVVKQATSASQTSITKDLGGTQLNETIVSFPLLVSLATVLDDTGTGTQVTKISQKFVQETLETGAYVNYARYDLNEVSPTDTLDILDDEYITGNANQASSQTYEDFDTNGTCFTEYVAAVANLVSAVRNGPCSANAEERALYRAVRR